MAFFKRLLGLKTVPQEETEAKEFYDDMTINIFARTLWGEARSEGVEGIEAVASVILNRVRVAKLFNGYWWGNDIIQVCQKPYQFSCWLKSDPQYQRVVSVISSLVNAWHVVRSLALFRIKLNAQRIITPITLVPHGQSQAQKQCVSGVISFIS